jgi:hypothetical protein
MPEITISCMRIPRRRSLRARRLAYAKRTVIPSVLTYHCDGEVRHGQEKAMILVYMNTFGHRMLDNADNIIATTRSYASNSPCLKNRDVTVVPTGVNICAFQPEYRPA